MGTLVASGFCYNAFQTAEAVVVTAQLVSSVIVVAEV
jgi:hypothetical protein